MSEDMPLETPCVECGRPVYTYYIEPYKSRLIELGVCFRCLHWLELVPRAGEPNVVRVNGVHYMIEPETPRGGMRGYGGGSFDVHFNDGREVKTTNLWCQGDIPAHFRERLPDNATLS